MGKTTQRADRVYKAIAGVTAAGGGFGALVTGLQYIGAGASETVSTVLRSIGPNATLAPQAGEIIVPVPEGGATPFNNLHVSVGSIMQNGNGTETAHIHTDCSFNCTEDAFGSHDYNVLVGHSQNMTVAGTPIQIATEKAGDTVGLHVSLITEHIKQAFDPIAAVVAQNVMWPYLEGFLVSMAVGVGMLAFRYYGIPKIASTVSRLRA